MVTTGLTKSKLDSISIPFENTSIKTALNDFSFKAIDYLYGMEPLSQNLFWAGEFKEYGETEADFGRPFYNAQYKIRNINIKMPTIEYDIDQLTRIPMPKSINWPQDVTIGFVEDVYHSVRNYHMSWLQRWYSRELDLWRVGPQGKFRSLKIIGFHYINRKNDTIVETPEIQPIMQIELCGMVPAAFGGDWVFDYANNGNESIMSVNYKISKTIILYNKELQVNGINDKSTVSGATGSDTIWAWNNNEKIRIARGTTSSMHSDISIG